MGGTDKIIDVQDNPGSEKDAGNDLLLHFGFNSTGRKGKKGLKFPVKKSVSPHKIFHTGRTIKMAKNELFSESVVVFPYKDDRKEGNIYIMEIFRCEYDDIIEAVLCEYYNSSKNVIIDMDEEALPLEEGYNKLRRYKTVDALMGVVLCEYK